LDVVDRVDGEIQSGVKPPHSKKQGSGLIFFGKCSPSRQLSGSIALCHPLGSPHLSEWTACRCPSRLARGLCLIEPNLLHLYRQPENEDMRDIAHGTAHLLHGTSEGRFTIRYATKSLSKKEIESVHYQYADLNEALARYNPTQMSEGWNTLPDGEEVFFISTPSAGLWSTREKIEGRKLCTTGSKSA
jgi:hypothetical protein